ncbi:MAG TPA: hypothetical protein VF587_07150, partial [Solirubrobacteraceae bacterium]
AAPAAPAATPRALGLRLKAARRLRRGKLRAGVTCDAACTVELTAVVKVGGRRKVVRATRTLAAGRTTTIALRLPRGAKRVALKAAATGDGVTPASAAKKLRVR